MDISIRKIRESDYNEVMSLWKYLGNRTDKRNFGKVMSMMKNNDNYQPFVAVGKNREVLGFVMFLQALSIGCDTGFPWICGLAVKEGFQRLKIGSRLLDHVENYGRERGIESVILNSRFKRKAAHALYESNGYSTDSYCFTKDILS